MGEFRNCSRCGTRTDTFCPTCDEWFEKRRPDPATMTPSEREKEFRSWAKAEIEFGKIHKRLEELVGRPVWTHEFGLNWEGLIQEAKDRPCELDMGKVMEPLVATGKPIVGVVLPDKEEEE